MLQTKDSFFTNEFFLIILKTSDNIDELAATKKKVDMDIARQRSKDTGGHDGKKVHCSNCKERLGKEEEPLSRIRRVWNSDYFFARKSNQ